MKTLPLSRRGAALALGLAGSLAGCASLLGDFSVGQGASVDGGPTVAEGGTEDAGGIDSSLQDAPSGLEAASGIDSGQDTGGNVAPDSGDAGGDQGAPWTPAVLDEAGELAAWLEASSANLVISGSLVEGWNDLSKNKNNATNPNDGPAVDPAVINGHDALHFTSHVVLGMADAVSLQFGTDQIYIGAVTKVTAGSPYFFSKVTTGVSGAGSYYKTGLMAFVTTGTAADGGTTVGPNMFIDGTNGASDEIAWAGPSVEDATFHVVGFRRTSSSSVALSVDEQPIESASVGSFDESEVGQAVEIGGVLFGTFNPPVDFEIAEIVMVHPSTGGVVGDTDVANVNAYLKQKYGL